MTATALPPRFSSFSSQMPLGTKATPSKSGSQTQTIQTPSLRTQFLGAEQQHFMVSMVVVVVEFDWSGTAPSQHSKSVLCGKEYGDPPSLEERTGYTAGCTRMKALRWRVRPWCRLRPTTPSMHTELSTSTPSHSRLTEEVSALPSQRITTRLSPPRTIQD